MRLHDLRHGAATLLLGAGVHPRVAQQLLRHASSKTTTEIYSHVTAAQERQAAEILRRRWWAEAVEIGVMTRYRIWPKADQSPSMHARHPPSANVDRSHQAATG